MEMTLWFELKASHIISVRTRTCHLRSETLERPVLSHPPDPRTRTHAHTGSQMQLFHHFFPSLSPSLQLRLILTDLRLKEETRIHSRNVSFTERAQPRMRLSTPSADPALLPGGGRKAAQFQSAQLAPGCILLMHKSSKRNEEAFRKCWYLRLLGLRRELEPVSRAERKLVVNAFVDNFTF